MEPRSLRRLSSIQPSKRNAIVAEGLIYLGKYVEQLAVDADWMHENDRTAAAAVLDVFAAEQAASFAVLIDLARAGWGNVDVVNTQIRRFSDHLARGLYVEAYWGSPATLGEIEDLFGTLRRSHYLDGPTDADWIFRNEVIERREGSLYVDYVASENNCSWESPLTRDHSFRVRPKLVELVVSLTALGVCDESALDRLAESWRGIDMSDRDLHWLSVREVNRDFVDWLLRTNGPSPTSHVQHAVEDWIHPLVHLEMTLIDVPRADLIADRDAWAAQGN